MYLITLNIHYLFPFLYQLNVLIIFLFYSNVINKLKTMNRWRPLCRSGLKKVGTDNYILLIN